MKSLSKLVAVGGFSLFFAFQSFAWAGQYCAFFVLENIVKDWTLCNHRNHRNE